MIKFKNHKSIFLASALTIGISIISSQNIFAATLTTRNYTVKSGDTLSKIAQKYKESLTTLRKDNNKWNDSIFPGQVLKVSGTTSVTVKKTVPSLKAAAPSTKKYTASDLNLLARLITAEAGGESYIAQVAVGAVVMNRVKSSEFPNSISAVINQKYNGSYQFTCVQNGNIKRPAPASDVKAALAAINGTNPIKNALFFNNGVKKSGSIKIGNMIFM
ncbi:cell wall hydrolase [Clostridium estertheticum]|uniref:LysM peptidoglycan-binding domain-containing protein n=1 Tax=Clostridium estertheticum TaxID=238834 RepID=A0A5N7IMD1_9CLOT|nr:cell wall hydrolase [Clostridium estertheticum]MBU3175694.1 cell wall hydrolase [Clostridium estertheticum]MBW9152985.1 cell wall hydrolase [Clostridium estertheticum]MBW9172400.1 cell wall hydrolase [Clostridium estertheticum]MBX4260993.1 cell wall hydrolase [Clostridium estertheticum]MPQ31463.1 LysM peptidoglycan-binding domain-containing protein [Clostridium estertheticum]